MEEGGTAMGWAIPGFFGSVTGCLSGFMTLTREEKDGRSLVTLVTFECLGDQLVLLQGFEKKGVEGWEQEVR